MNNIAGITSSKTKINYEKLQVLADFHVNSIKNNVQTQVYSSEKYGFCKLDDNTFFKAENDSISVFIAGRIYNIEEIKEKFCKEKKEDFFCPSEIIYHAYLAEKEKFIEHCNGAFIVVINDSSNNETFIFRDRIGKLPLLYIWEKEILYYSNSLTSLTPFVDREDWSSTAIQHYFRLGFIPAPHTIYTSIYKLEPGFFLHISIKGLKKEPYWELEKQISEKSISDEKEAKDRYHTLLRESVRLQLSSSTGTFLSGGIDSSLVTAVAQSQSASKLDTFSIAFKDEKRDESKYSKKISAYLGTNHQERLFTVEDVKEAIYKIPQWYEEPYADSSAFPTYIVSEFAKNKVKDVLTGDGGDEQFLGYGMHIWAERLKRLHSSRKIVKLLLEKSPILNHNRAAQYFDFSKEEGKTTHIFSVDQGFFSSFQLKNYFYFETEKLERLKVKETKRKLSPAETQALFELKYYVPDDLLRKVERATAQHQLFAHAPLLDYRLIQESLNYSQKLKIKNQESKYLLRSLLFEYLPKELFDRPKQGFGIPLNKWLKEELREVLEENINKEVLSKYSFYNVEAILELKEEFLKGKTYLYNQLWLILMFNVWAKFQEER